ncbi:unnamed protein product [Pylaiella littoralis]
MMILHRSTRITVICCCGMASSSSGVNTNLLSQTELSTNCYNFPEESFGSSNSVRNSFGSSPHLMLELGTPAVDFTLHDTDGARWNLGEVLETGGGKPVVLIFGMSSCPAYQGLDSDGSTDRWAYWDEHALVEDYGDDAIFVHVYGPEPHPASPDINFDSGRLLPNFWSVRRQPVTYDDRLDRARNIRSITHPDQVILPDYLTSNPYSSLNQPVWCTYAHGARSSVVVASSGHVFYQQGWLNTDSLGEAIDAYWKQGGEGTWTDGDDIPSPKDAAGKGKVKKPKVGQGKGSRKHHDLKVNSAFGHR